MRHCVPQLVRLLLLAAAFTAAAAHAATPHVSAAKATGHALALKSDGSVLAWGNDLYGQLGGGRALVVPAPAKIPGLPVMTRISAFSDHVLALDGNGRVWAWGASQFGQLGMRVERNAAKPGVVHGLTNVVQVEAGGRFSVARKSDNTVWVWGLHNDGAGDGSPEPVRIFADAIDISAGERHLLILKSDRTVWAYGDNLSGQLGLGDQQRRTTPTQIPGLSNVARISVDIATSAALTQSGALYLWGQLDHSSNGAPRMSPGAVAGLPAGDPIVDFVGAHGGYIALQSGRLFRFTINYGVQETLPAVPAGTPVRMLGQTSATSNSVGVVLQNGGMYVYSANSYGESGIGSTVVNTGGASARTQPQGLPAVVAVEGGRATLFALTQAGEVWAWGLDSEGVMGNGVITVTSTPRPVPGLPQNIVQVEAGYFYSMALASDGFVWTWGNGSAGELGRGFTPPTSVPAKATIDAVAAIAACASANSLYLKADGTVWQTGMGAISGINSGQFTQVSGLPPIAKVACGWNSFFAIDHSARLWAWGENHRGLLGDGTLNNRPQPFQVASLGAAVASVTASQYGTMAVKTDGTVWAWGRNPATVGSDDEVVITTPAQLAGVTGATQASFGANHVLIRFGDGTVKSYGIPTAALGSDYMNQGDDEEMAFVRVPQPVLELDGVESVTAASQSSFAMRNDGTVFAWGENCTAAQQCQTLGDGTFAPRARPVVMLRENAAGNLSTNDWFLDLKPGVTKAIPAAKVPRLIPVATALSGAGLLNIDAAINYRQTDNGRNVGVFVVGLVPPAFLDQVKASAAEKARARARAKNGEPVLVQLTPNGWATVTGQLIAFSTATVNGNGSAQNILNNVRGADIPGARFCIGYGSNADDMLSQGTLRDVVALPGAASTVSGSPCVLAGIYVSGPASSTAGTTVDFKATVVGAANPSGTVQFRDAGAALGSALTVSPVNPAVASASLSTSSLAAGEHGIHADYSGDANNPASRSDALVHKVVPAASGTSVALSGPASSRTGEEVAFNAAVTGRNPTGSVQFKDGAANLGAAVPVSGGMAVLRIATLAAGSHSITAVYSGDASNGASTSAAVAHTVAAIVATEVTANASNERPARGEAVVLGASVIGNAPTGSVTFLDVSTGRSYGPATVSAGVAQTTASDLAVGAHLITATYSGDGNNLAATSGALVVVVQPPAVLQASPSLLAFGGNSIGTTSAPLTVTLSNTGAAAVTVTSASGSDGFTATHACGTLQPSASCTAQVTFRPMTQGPVAGTLTIGTSAGIATVPLTGTGELSLVTHYYRAILNRAPDASGKAFWDGEFARLGSLGANPVESWFLMANYFFNSQEYVAANKTNTAFMIDVYNTFFNRPPDQSGFDFWMSQLNAGLSREGLIFWFMFSNEFRAFTQNIFGNTAARPEVDMVMDLFRGILNRFPETAALNAYVGQLRSAQCTAQNQRAGAVYTAVNDISYFFLFGSSEYANRNRSNKQFVSDLYNAFLRRGGTADELAGWIRHLDEGTNDRNQLRAAFIGTPEFGARVNAVINAGCLP